MACFPGIGLTRCSGENIFYLNFIFIIFLFSRQEHCGGLKAAALTPYNRGGHSLARKVGRWYPDQHTGQPPGLLGGLFFRPPLDYKRDGSIWKGLLAWGFVTFKCTGGWVIIFLTFHPFILSFLLLRCEILIC